MSSIEECKTFSGAGCVFPFIFNDVTYTECTDIRNKDIKDEPKNMHWCATEVDGGGKYKGKWGRCAPECFGKIYDDNNTNIFQLSLSVMKQS